jgi:threonine dehydratase
MSKTLIDNVVDGIKDALFQIYEVARMTPLNISNNLSKMTGGSIYLKHENMQRTGSFKLRGAYYSLRKAKEEAIITASDGNHAQGAALSASFLGKKLVVVMPEYTSNVKINATRDYGGEVILYGKTYDDAINYAVEYAEEKKARFIHPYDELNIIAGNGTVATEILDDLRNIDMVIVPIGGGALISGIASYLKKTKPSVKIIGVQSKASPSMKLSLDSGKLMKISPKPTIAEGISISSPGELCFKIVSETVDDIVIVDDDEIAYALYILFERVKTVAEPAGAASVAALLNGYIEPKGNTVAIISGGNIDAPLLSKVLLQGMNKSGRLVKLDVALIDKPGELERFIDIITNHRANIVNIFVDYVAKVLTPSYSKVTILMEIPTKEELEIIVSEIKNRGYSLLNVE